MFEKNKIAAVKKRSSCTLYMRDSGVAVRPHDNYVIIIPEHWKVYSTRSVVGV